MEFWGVEVKAGESLKVKFEDDKILHLSQAALGESKKEKGNESIPLFLKVDQQKLVLGTLSPANIPQLSFDLVFDKEFELSHNWKNGSVFFLGYKSVLPEEEEFSEFDDSDSGEDLPINTFENGKPEPKVEQAKAVPTNANAAKAKVKVEEPPKVAKGKEDDDDDDSDEDIDDEDSDEDESDEDMSDAEDGSDEGSESENEETPKKAEPGKKRPTPTESATKTPVPAKKAKLVSPQKTDGKKGGAHTATPHPNKKAGKTPASSDKGKGQSPKSGGQVSCKSCSKTFNSENALQSHAKAKHATS